MKMTRVFGSLVTLVMLLTSGMVVAEESSAHAKYNGENNFRMGVRAGLGIGGELEAEIGPQELEYDMDTTFVGAGFLEYTEYENVHFGAIVGAHFWNADDFDDSGIDGSTFVDISPFLKLLMPYKEGKGELYAMVAPGLTVSLLNEDFEDKFQPPVETTAVGLNVNVLFGLSYMFNESVGGLFDLGWTFRSVTHEIDSKSQNAGEFSGGQSSIDEVETEMSQFALNVGFFTNF